MGRKTGSNVITSSVSNLAGRFTAALAMFGLVAAPMTVSAQEAGANDAAAAPASALNPLGIPENFSLLGETNPNLRVATAVVNGTVITGTDVDQRTALIVSASRGSLSDEEIARVKMQVLRNLIDETLQVQEAAAQEIEVDAAEINQRYEQLAAQNFGQKDAMDSYLLSIGSSPASLKRQIQGELAWQRLIRRNIGNFVNVSEAEAQEYIKRLEESRGEEEFHVMEIYLSATTETETAVINNSRRIMEQLRAGGSFQGYARQYSEASTAAVGGDLGYVLPGTLPTQMAAAIQSMQPGQLTGPVQIPGGFVIIYLRDRRKILMADPRDAKLSLKQISIRFAPNVTEEQATQQLEAFQVAVQSIRGCGDAERAAATVGAEVVVNDEIVVRNLPEQLQPTLLGLQIGQATPPFGSLEDGVRVLLLCGRDDPEVAGLPTIDEVIGILENERIQKRAQRYLRDLRNDAYIEYN